VQFRTIFKKLLRVKNVIIERVYFEEKDGGEILVIRIRQPKSKKADAVSAGKKRKDMTAAGA
jgi:hypothetical protein